MDHLRDEGYQDMGIQSYKIVQAQVGVHNVSKPPVSKNRGANISGGPEKEHSNVHLGELYWEADPTNRGSDPAEQTHLEVEVDYIENPSLPGNGNPANRTNNNGITVLEAAERNYRLYGLAVEFHVDQKITMSDLSSTCKASRQSRNQVRKICPESTPPSRQINVTPDSFNRYELGVVEDKYHDDDSRLHLLWGTQIGSDDPETIVDQDLDYGSIGPTGMAQHTGAPNAEEVDIVEDRDFGLVIARDHSSLRTFQDYQSVTMHELGHALSVGWRDDKQLPIPLGNHLCGKCLEVYSGAGNPTKIGGVDPTNESVITNPPSTGQRWSIMSRGTADDTRGFTETTARFPILAFSIEEFVTADFEHIPSKTEE